MSATKTVENKPNYNNLKDENDELFWECIALQTVDKIHKRKIQELETKLNSQKKELVDVKKANDGLKRKIVELESNLECQGQGIEEAVKVLKSLKKVQ
jgi:predicted RNase H-like nuclease (RuvC/YqgF family)